MSIVICGSMHYTGRLHACIYVYVANNLVRKYSCFINASSHSDTCCIYITQP